MTIVEKLIRTPGMDVKEWFLPKYLNLIYWFNLVVGTIGITVFFVSCAIGLCQYQNPFAAIGTIMLGSILFLLAIVLFFVFNRLWYEMGILLFRVFHSQRDMVDGLNKIVNSVELMSQMQIKSGQYYCDRLADICDLLKVGGANDQ